MNLKKYDYLIVGTGLFGSVFAHEAHQYGKKCLVIDKRSHQGGNIYCRRDNEINIHEYGAHIFHTNDKEVWNFISKFVEINRYINAPIALYKGEVYNLPFNMNTFSKLWGVIFPDEARKVIESQQKLSMPPANLEEQAIHLVGRDIYEKLIKGYTEKQWGRPCSELPPFIIKRIPVRYTYDNNYFNDLYQGVVTGGYTKLIDKLLEGVEIKLNEDFLCNRSAFSEIAEKVIFTGQIDAYFDYSFGPLEYRSLRFEHETLHTGNYQGNAVVNYTDAEVPYTRIIEHKHFEFGTQPVTIITREYPVPWKPGKEPFYPVNDDKNQQLYQRYVELASQTTHNVIFGGRLGEYKYYNMDQVIRSALDMARKELQYGH